MEEDTDEVILRLTNQSAMMNKSNANLKLASSKMIVDFDMDSDDCCTSISQRPVNPLFELTDPIQKVQLPPVKMVTHDRFWQGQAENLANINDQEAKESTSSVGTFSAQTTAKHPIVFAKWYPELIDNELQISGDTDTGYFVSRPIERRISGYIFIDKSETPCSLAGPMTLLDTQPKIIQQKFFHGIPEDWVHVRSLWIKFKHLGAPEQYVWSCDSDMESDTTDADSTIHAHTQPGIFNRNQTVITGDLPVLSTPRNNTNNFYNITDISKINVTNFTGNSRHEMFQNHANFSASRSIKKSYTSAVLKRKLSKYNSMLKVALMRENSAIMLLDQEQDLSRLQSEHQVNRTSQNMAMARLKTISEQADNESQKGDTQGSNNASRKLQNSSSNEPMNTRSKNCINMPSTSHIQMHDFSNLQDALQNEFSKKSRKTSHITSQNIKVSNSEKSQINKKSSSKNTSSSSKNSSVSKLHRALEGVKEKHKTNVLECPSGENTMSPKTRDVSKLHDISQQLFTIISSASSEMSALRVSSPTSDKSKSFKTVKSAVPEQQDASETMDNQANNLVQVIPPVASKDNTRNVAHKDKVNHDANSGAVVLNSDKSLSCNSTFVDDIDTYPNNLNSVVISYHSSNSINVAPQVSNLCISHNSSNGSHNVSQTVKNSAKNSRISASAIKNKEIEDALANLNKLESDSDDSIFERRTVIKESSDSDSIFLIKSKNLRNSEKPRLTNLNSVSVGKKGDQNSAQIKNAVTVNLEKSTAAHSESSDSDEDENLYKYNVRISINLEKKRKPLNSESSDSDQQPQQQKKGITGKSARKIIFVSSSSDNEESPSSNLVQKIITNAVVHSARKTVTSEINTGRVTSNKPVVVVSKSVQHSEYFIPTKTAKELIIGGKEKMHLAANNQKISSDDSIDLITRCNSQNKKNISRGDMAETPSKQRMKSPKIIRESERKIRDSSGSESNIAPPQKRTKNSEKSGNAKKSTTQGTKNQAKYQDKNKQEVNNRIMQEVNEENEVTQTPRRTEKKRSNSRKSAQQIDLVQTSITLEPDQSLINSTVSQRGRARCVALPFWIGARLKTVADETIVTRATVLESSNRTVENQKRLLTPQKPTSTAKKPRKKTPTVASGNKPAFGNTTSSTDDVDSENIFNVQPKSPNKHTSKRTVAKSPVKKISNEQFILTSLPDVDQTIDISDRFTHSKSRNRTEISRNKLEIDEEISTANKNVHRSRSENKKGIDTSNTSNKSTTGKHRHDKNELETPNSKINSSRDFSERNKINVKSPVKHGNKKILTSPISSNEIRKRRSRSGSKVFNTDSVELSNCDVKNMSQEYPESENGIIYARKDSLKSQNSLKRSQSKPGNEQLMPSNNKSKGNMLEQQCNEQSPKTSKLKSKINQGILMKSRKNDNNQQLKLVEYSESETEDVSMITEDVESEQTPILHKCLNSKSKQQTSITNNKNKDNERIKKKQNLPESENDDSDKKFEPKKLNKSKIRNGKNISKSEQTNLQRVKARDDFNLEDTLENIIKRINDENSLQKDSAKSGTTHEKYESRERKSHGESAPENMRDSWKGEQLIKLKVKGKDRILALNSPKPKKTGKATNVSRLEGNKINTSEKDINISFVKGIDNSMAVSLPVRSELMSDTFQTSKAFPMEEDASNSECETNIAILDYVPYDSVATRKINRSNKKLRSSVEDCHENVDSGVEINNITGDELRTNKGDATARRNNNMQENKNAKMAISEITHSEQIIENNFDKSDTKTKKNKRFNKKNKRATDLSSNASISNSGKPEVIKGRQQQRNEEKEEVEKEALKKKQTNTSESRLNRVITISNSLINGFNDTINCSSLNTTVSNRGRTRIPILPFWNGTRVIRINDDVENLMPKTKADDTINRSRSRTRTPVGTQAKTTVKPPSSPMKSPKLKSSTTTSKRKQSATSSSEHEFLVPQVPPSKSKKYTERKLSARNNVATETGNTFVNTRRLTSSSPSDSGSVTSRDSSISSRQKRFDKRNHKASDGGNSSREESIRTNSAQETGGIRGESDTSIHSKSTRQKRTNVPKHKRIKSNERASEQSGHSAKEVKNKSLKKGAFEFDKSFEFAVPKSTSKHSIIENSNNNITNFVEHRMELRNKNVSSTDSSASCVISGSERQKRVMTRSGRSKTDDTESEQSITSNSSVRSNKQTRKSTKTIESMYASKNGVVFLDSIPNDTIQNLKAINSDDTMVQSKTKDKRRDNQTSQTINKTTQRTPEKNVDSSSKTKALTKKPRKRKSPTDNYLNDPRRMSLMIKLKRKRKSKEEPPVTTSNLSTNSINNVTRKTGKRKLYSESAWTNSEEFLKSFSVNDKPKSENYCIQVEQNNIQDDDFDDVFSEVSAFVRK